MRIMQLTLLPKAGSIDTQLFPDSWTNCAIASAGIRSLLKDQGLNAATSLGFPVDLLRRRIAHWHSDRRIVQMSSAASGQPTDSIGDGVIYSSEHDIRMRKSI